MMTSVGYTQNDAIEFERSKNNFKKSTKINGIYPKITGIKTVLCQKAR